MYNINVKTTEDYMYFKPTYQDLIVGEEVYYLVEGGDWVYTKLNTIEDICNLQYFPLKMKYLEPSDFKNAGFIEGEILEGRYGVFNDSQLYIKDNIKLFYKHIEKKMYILKTYTWQNIRARDIEHTLYDGTCKTKFQFNFLLDNLNI